MGSFARLDPPLAGVRREVGPLLLAWHFLAELDLIGTVDRALPQRGRQQLSVGEVGRGADLQPVCARPRRCMTSPGGRRARPCRSCWGSRRRCSTMIGSGGRWRSSRCTRRRCAGALAARAIERFGIDAGRLHVDLTHCRVSRRVRGLGAGRQGLGVRTARSARQVRALQAASADGVSLYMRPDPGNAAEVSLIAAEPRAAQAALRAGRTVDLGLRLRAAEDAVRDRPRGPAVHRAAPRTRPGFASGSWPTSATTACERCATSRSAEAKASDGAAHPLPRRAARLGDHRPRERRDPDASALPTSTHQKSNARPPAPASARCKKAEERCSACATGSAGATTRPANRSRRESLGSSPPTSRG